MSPRWIRLEGGHCSCSRCGELVSVSWRYFERPTLWTIALCEPCVELELG